MISQILAVPDNSNFVGVKSQVNYQIHPNINPTNFHFNLVLPYEVLEQFWLDQPDSEKQYHNYQSRRRDRVELVVRWAILKREQGPYLMV